MKFKVEQVEGPPTRLNPSFSKTPLPVKGAEPKPETTRVPDEGLPTLTSKPLLKVPAVADDKTGVTIAGLYVTAKSNEVMLLPVVSETLTGTSIAELPDAENDKFCGIETATASVLPPACWTVKV